MEDPAEILYSGFWDRPLAFVVQYQGVQFYFRREFDEQIDEYQDTYEVFTLPNLTGEQIISSWGHLSQHIVRHLGQIAVNEVIFDQTFRRSIDTDLLKTLIRKSG